MNANGSRFHLVLTADDWGRWRAGGMPLADAWHASPPPEPPAPVDWRCGDLRLRSELFAFRLKRSDSPAMLDQRRGAGADRYGNVYWIGDDRRSIMVQSAGDGRVSRFWPVDAAPLRRLPGDFGPVEVAQAAPALLGGLAVSEDHYLIAGSIAPAGLLLFDLFGGGAPTVWRWPAAVPFVPWDMAPRPGGGVWVLDRANRRYWGIDRQLRVCPGGPEPAPDAAPEAQFQPEPPRGVRREPLPRFGAGFDLAWAASPLASGDPIAIEALPDGSVLILDRGEGRFSRIERYRAAQRLGEPVSFEVLAALIVDEERATFELHAHDFVLLPASGDVPPQLIVASSEGNQGFAFDVHLDQPQFSLRPEASYLPMRRFGGKGLLLRLGVAHYDFGEGWVPLLAQSRPRFAGRAEIDSADSGFDGGEPDCVWHRLVFDAALPAETGIEIWSRCANDRVALAVAPWRREPDPYPRNGGPELPWLRLPAARNGIAYGHWETLLQAARGRYLQLRLVLTGNSRATPRIRAVRAWYPRFSYLERYLPAVYREDAESASFLDRFLANIEAPLTEIEDRIVEVATLFDWRSAPPEALDWLASWYEVALDPAWEEWRRRLLLHHVLDVYAWRGTVHGLRMALSLALDACLDETAFAAPGQVPESRQRYRIVERYLTRSTPGVLWGEPLDPGSVPVQPAGRWTPAEFGAGLQARYRKFIEAGTGQPTPNARFELIAPTDTDAATQWARFATQQLGFVPEAGAEGQAWRHFLTDRYEGDVGELNIAHAGHYASFDEITVPAGQWQSERQARDWRDYLATAGDGRLLRARGLWQGFLKRRYQRAKPLNDAWRGDWHSLDELVPPERLPSDGAALSDWYQFETVVKKMDGLAHRFRVLIPSLLDADTTALARRLAVAKRVVELAKPAHTTFDVGYYWALLRVGEARLGLDTLVDRGARALQPPFTLGVQHVGEGYLAPRGDRPGGMRYPIEC
ncbi:phage tail protein [Chitinivorax sp. PXF-14]|uniref:phage tail protein n=1 Tax=Chitinivorax sp. PXF-14 TaxID=3230488 RepID=UPI0034662DE6